MAEMQTPQGLVIGLIPEAKREEAEKEPDKPKRTPRAKKESE